MLTKITCWIFENLLTQVFQKISETSCSDCIFGTHLTLETEQSPVSLSYRVPSNCVPYTVKYCSCKTESGLSLLTVPTQLPSGNGLITYHTWKHHALRSKEVTRSWLRSAIHWLSQGKGKGSLPSFTFWQEQRYCQDRVPVCGRWLLSGQAGQPPVSPSA